MKIRIIILLAIFALLLVSGAALAQWEAKDPDSSVASLPQNDTVNGVASGGRYRLVTWQVSIAASGLANNVAAGGKYRLLGPASPSGTGTPCCCIHLPCVMRKK